MHNVYHHAMATQDDYVKTALRLPRALHAAIQAAADASSKSMNAEIIARLQRTDESSLEDLRTIRAQALQIANLEFNSARQQSEIERLKMLLAIAVSYLPKSDPHAQEIIDEFNFYKPDKALVESLAAEMKKHLAAIRSAYDDLDEVVPRRKDHK